MCMCPPVVISILIHAFSSKKNSFGFSYKQSNSFCQQDNYPIKGIGQRSKDGTPLIKAWCENILFNQFTLFGIYIPSISKKSKQNG